MFQREGVFGFIERRLSRFVVPIAWLSVGVITVSWAVGARSTIGSLGAPIGAFGLVVAYFVDFRDRYRVVWRAGRLRKALDTKPVTKLTGRPRDSVHLLCTQLERRGKKRQRVRGTSGEYEDRLVRIAPLEAGINCADVPVVAFVRDLSHTGIGLKQDVVLPIGLALLEFVTDDDRWEFMLVDVRWSKPAHNGWYFSGCEFVGDWTDAERILEKRSEDNTRAGADRATQIDLAVT